LEIRKPDYYLEAYKGNFEKLFNGKKLREELGKNGRKFKRRKNILDYYETF